MEKEKKPEIVFPQYFVHKAYKHYIKLVDSTEGYMIKMHDGVVGNPGVGPWRHYEYCLKAAEPSLIFELLQKSESYVATTANAWNRAIDSFKNWSDNNFNNIYKKAL